MLNWAIRYRPIVKEIQHHQPTWVLDVGSGPEGLGMFWKGEVVGAALQYKRRPIHNALKADALYLPFPENSCPFVICCDLLEHIHPIYRKQAIIEMSRVANEHLVMVFPSGEEALQVYRSFANSFSIFSKPSWLQQHLVQGLPDVNHIENWVNESGWKTNTIWFDSANNHKMLLNLELRFGFKYFTYFMLRLFGSQIIQFLPQFNADPKMRVLMLCSRD